MDGRDSIIDQFLYRESEVITRLQNVQTCSALQQDPFFESIINDLLQIHRNFSEKLQYAVEINKLVMSSSPLVGKLVRSFVQSLVLYKPLLSWFDTKFLNHAYEHVRLSTFQTVKTCY